MMFLSKIDLSYIVQLLVHCIINNYKLFSSRYGNINWYILVIFKYTYLIISITIRL